MAEQLLQKPAAERQGQAGTDVEDPKAAKARELPVDEALRLIAAEGNGWWAILCTNALCINCAMQAVETSVLTYLTSCAEGAFHLTTTDTAFLASVVYIGMGIGALLLNPLADVIGRWKILLGSSVGLVVFGLLSAVSPNYNCLLICRCLVGASEGVFMVALDLLAEYVPPERRGFILNLTSVAWGVGAFFVCVVAQLLIPYFGWRVFLAVVTLPFAYNIIQILYLVESPRWLLEEERHDEAMEAVRHIAKMNGCDAPCDRLSLPKGSTSELVPQKRASQIFEESGYMSLVWLMFSEYADVLDRKHIRTTVPILMAFACIYFVFYAVTLYDGDVLDEQVMGTCHFDYPLQILLSSANVLGPALVLFTIDRTDLGLLGGRLGTQLWTYAAGVVFIFLTGLQSTQAIAVLWAYMARGALSAGSGVLTVHAAELFETRHRATGTGLANMVGVLASVFNAYWVYAPYSQLVKSAGLAFLTLVGFISICTLPETNQMELDTQLS